MDVSGSVEVQLRRISIYLNVTGSYCLYPVWETTGDTWYCEGALNRSVDVQKIHIKNVCCMGLLLLVYCSTNAV